MPRTVSILDDLARMLHKRPNPVRIELGYRQVEMLVAEIGPVLVSTHAQEPELTPTADQIYGKPGRLFGTPIVWRGQDHLAVVYREDAS